jgi:hypothetical protein
MVGSNSSVAAVAAADARLKRPSRTLVIARELPFQAPVVLLLEDPHPDLSLHRSGLLFGHGGMFAPSVTMRFGRLSQIEQIRLDGLPTASGRVRGPYLG